MNMTELEADTTTSGEDDDIILLVDSAIGKSLEVLKMIGLAIEDHCSVEITPNTELLVTETLVVG